MCRFAFLLLLAAPFAQSQIRINEVLFFTDPSSQDVFRTEQWLELYNSGLTDVSLTGWSVTGANGLGSSSARPLPSATLPAGAYLVVHFSTGQNQLDFTNGSGDFYTGEAGATYWSVDSDESALYSPTGIADFIAWARSTVTYRPGQAHGDAVAAKLWTSGAVLVHDQIGREQLELLRAVKPGDSIGRDLNSKDTDQPSDFDAGGGSSGMGPTQGRQNFTMAPLQRPAITAVHPRSPARPQADPVKKKWTVLLYMSADNNTQEWFWDNLIQLQQAGGSSADVNFVTMYDPLTILPSTYRGLIGGPQPLNPLTNATPLNLTNPDDIVDIGERDMGDPQELAGFIQWAKQTYPADKYALILGSHGSGWKGFGPDVTSAGTRGDADRLYMGEFSTALAGQSFEWIAFHACLMASVEVAHQLQPYAKYLLASEELALATDFPYAAMAEHMAAHPDWTALQSITDIHAEYVIQALLHDPAQYTISVMDLTKLPDLITNIRAWADLLAPGMSLFQTRDTPLDNVQIITKNVLDPVQRFNDRNFIDLYDFADRMQTSTIPPCLLSPVQSIKDIIKNKVVILEAHGAGHPLAHGVHIYFPRFRMIDLPANGAIFFPNFTDQPYDLPKSRTFDGSSPFAHYGRLADQLPLRTLDPETGKDFDIGNVDLENLSASGLIWPLPQSPGFKFPNDTGWRKVLDRYYHPTADNHILPVLIAGVLTQPTQSGGGACSNPSDSITVPVGTTVMLSGKGSSDADQKAGVVPSYYWWDKDAKVGCTVGCLQPFAVPPGTDAALAATDNMDADQDRANTTFDDKDGGPGPQFAFTCATPGTFVITLMPWDDDHLFPFHNTLPTAEYVHPQSAKHPATITCADPPPPTYHCPMSGMVPATFTVSLDPFFSAIYIALSNGTLFFTRSGTLGTQVMISSTTGQLVPAAGTFDPIGCSLTATGVSQSQIAGFSNVQAQYNLTIGGPKFDMVTGTYKVGLNSTLNNEPQPVTYTVTGTVTNPK